MTRPMGAVPAAQAPCSKLPFGIPALDEATGGGIPMGSFFVLVMPKTDAAAYWPAHEWAHELLKRWGTDREVRGWGVGGLDMLREKAAEPGEVFWWAPGASMMTGESVITWGLYSATREELAEAPEVLLASIASGGYGLMLLSEDESMHSNILRAARGMLAVDRQGDHLALWTKSTPEGPGRIEPIDLGVKLAVKGKTSARKRKS